MAQEEIWKDISGFEGLYQVSNLGRIRSLKQFYFRVVLTPQCGRRGYLYVMLRKDGKSKLYNIHRLVAMAFNPNPDNLPVVYHKDGVRTNNRADNLLWCSHEYKNSHNLTNEKKIKKVYQYALDGKFIKVWNSAKMVEKELGYNNNCIRRCCGGLSKTGYGFIWRYTPLDYTSYMKLFDKKVYQYTLNGDLVKIWVSAREVQRCLNIPSRQVSSCCKGFHNTAKGFIWSHVPLDKTSCQKKSKNLNKKLLQYTLDGKLVNVWETAAEVKKQLNYNEGCISACCSGKHKTAYGYIWKRESYSV